MIERLLAADAALDRDDLDTAAKLFGQVAEADPRNAIAAVGLGRVAAGRDDAAEARMWFRRALEIDPQEVAAQRLLAALDRELAAPVATSESATSAAATSAATSVAAASAATSAASAVPGTHAPVTPGRATPPRHDEPAAQPPSAANRRSLMDRLRAWLGLGGRRG